MNKNLKIKRNVFALIALSLLLLCMLLQAIKSQFWDFKCEAIYEVPKHIQYAFTIKNKTNRLISGTEFFVLGPVKRTSTQHCEEVTASYPFEVDIDDCGNQILHFEIEKIAPYSDIIIKIKSILSVSSEPNKIIMNKDFLNQETFVESENSDIRELAGKLRAPSRKETAEKIFEWVATKIRYTGYRSVELGALYALTKGEGDCTEFADLFVALCRASNIPARFVAGYICPQHCTLKPNDYHNWAEFYMDGKWHIADPQNKKIMVQSEHYIAVKMRSNHQGKIIPSFDRYRIKGKGLVVTMN